MQKYVEPVPLSMESSPQKYRGYTDILQCIFKPPHQGETPMQQADMWPEVWRVVVYIFYQPLKCQGRPLSGVCMCPPSLLNKTTFGLPRYIYACSAEMFVRFGGQMH